MIYYYVCLYRLCLFGCVCLVVVFILCIFVFVCFVVVVGFCRGWGVETVLFKLDVTLC